MEYMHAATQGSTISTVPEEDARELTIQDVLNGVVTIDEYHSAKEE